MNRRTYIYDGLILENEKWVRVEFKVSATGITLYMAGMLIEDAYKDMIRLDYESGRELITLEY